MCQIWRTLVAVAAIASTTEVEGTSAARTAPMKHDTSLMYVAVAPTDPFVEMTAALFVDDYQTKLDFHFATIHANRVVSAEVAKHNGDNAGDTYRVNLFLALHFDSPHFGGPKYHTVASADYTCTNDTTTDDLCTPDAFLENPRTVHTLDTIPNLVKDTLNSVSSNITVLFEQMAIHFTAYETQALTTHTPNALMHYVAFAIHDQPVPCRASLYYDGARTHVLHYNTDCLTATYDSAMLRTAERDGIPLMFKVVGTVAGVAAVLGMFLVRRAGKTPPKAYTPVRLQKEPADYSPKAEIRDPSKSYSSMAV
ncbi:hypothetical protein DYB36_002926 [Aphanomyces astaci]|uniref:Uncharacterized protein n=1 Tax=Aphanomyces astaci TaxID=112090 RepID=A0A397A4X7_APHAT|nr:hypothetical protein DYB36_002926 [Aphanomyces astaci]